MMTIPATQAPRVTSRFLRALFDGKPPHLYILVWTMFRKLSRWFRDVDDAAFYAGNCSHLDTYVGVSLSHLDRGPKQRGDAKESSGIVGLWADIDTLHPCHSKKNLPPDLGAALSLLAGLPEPSLIVHTGHGAQPWWLFKEPWIFDSDADRKDAMVLAEWWKQTLRMKAAARGWDVDSVSDLARVLRIPGTTNCKDELVPVTCPEIHDLQYNPGDFTGHLLGPRPVPSAKRTATSDDGQVDSSGAYVLDANAEPPAEKLALNLDIDVKFKKTWRRKRPDLQDQSASGYNQSLANLAAMADWTDQEIVDLLIAWRREHGEGLKLRQDYYARTIQKAKETAAKWRFPG